MAPIILPPVARNPNRIGGIVQGTSITIGGQNPIVTNNQPTKIQATGAKINGIPKIGFNTNGIPNVTVSLILNNPGTIDNVAIARLSSRLEKMKIAIRCV